MRESLSGKPGGADKGPTRRNVLGGMAAAAAAAAGAFVAERLLNSHEEHRQAERGTIPQTEGNATPELGFLRPIAEHPQHCPAGPLAGHVLSDLYAYYVGYREGTHAIGQWIDVDFQYQLAILWQRKLALVESLGNPSDTLRVRELAEPLYTSYDRHGSKPDIGKYETSIDRAIAPVRRELERAFDRGLAERLDLTTDQAHLANEAQRHLGSKELTACSLTELMPSVSGDFNRDMLDFLLRNAGEEFINRIPALHDTYISFGPYQMTNKALLGGGGHFGAQNIDRLLDRPFLPNDVSELRSAQHHQAAFLFAVGNLLHLAKELRPLQVAEARRLFADTSNVLAYVAVAHNKPAEGRHAIEAVLEARIAHEKYLHTIRGHTRTAERHAPHSPQEIRDRLDANHPNLVTWIKDRASRTYAEKTMANFAALSHALY